MPFVAQVQAILAMDDALRTELTGVAVPTLVLVGSQDILTPMGDSEEIAELVPGAELAVIRGAAHGFMLEHAGAFNRTVLDFLDRTTSTRLVAWTLAESDGGARGAAHGWCPDGEAVRREGASDRRHS